MIIALERLDPTLLPVESAVSAITMAELAGGPHVARDLPNRAEILGVVCLVATTRRPNREKLVGRNPGWKHIEQLTGLDVDDPGRPLLAAVAATPHRSPGTWSAISM